MKSTAIAVVSLLLFLSIPIHLKTASAEASSQEVCVDFGSKAAGASVNGLGAVHPQLNISSTNNAVVVKQSVDPVAYGGNFTGPDGQIINNVPNACIGPGAGFADLGAAAGNFSVDSRLHDYVFTFAPGTSVSEFSLRIVDHGDFNPGHATSHSVKLVAYNASGDIVDEHELAYTSTNATNPLGVNGDACTAPPGEPGNFTFNVSGSHITRLELRSSNNGPSPNEPSDPLIGFNVLCFVLESTEVQIDIKPGTNPNTVNLGSNGTVPVAVLSSPSFSAAAVSPLTVRLAGVPVSIKRNGTPMASLEDVNGDGLLDLVLHFSTQALPRFTSDTVITLVGETYDGELINGSDSIVIVP
ncbi:MAG TPA: hypothetical protein VFF31_00440 [Blastocatellia bacterium]|nr:hypothetical protein [Blastocatellia bacterium]